MALSEDVGALDVSAPDAAADRMWEEEWRRYHLRQAMLTIRSAFNEADRAAFDRVATLQHDDLIALSPSWYFLGGVPMLTSPLSIRLLSRAIQVVPVSSRPEMVCLVVIVQAPLRLPSASL